MDKEQYDDFYEEVKEEYDEIREDHYDSLKVKLRMHFIFSSLLFFVTATYSEPSYIHIPLPHILLLKI